MNIAIIVPSLRDKAPVNVALSIAVNLANTGNNVTLYYLSNRIEIELPPQVSFKKLSFFDNIDWNKYDIVHSHSFLPDAFVFLKKPLKCKVKAVTTIHNYVFIDLKTYYNWIVSFVLGSVWLLLWIRFDKLVVLTDDALKYYKSISFNKNLLRIYNGRDIKIDANAILADHKRIIEEMKNKFSYSIGVYSALISRKRIDIVIRHLNRVVTGCLIILGDGPERKNLEDLVLKFNLEHRVKFLGHVAQAHQYNLLFDIFAHPSLSEGFSLSLIEAALHKKKIVCSDIPGFREAFNDTEVTFFDSNDELSFDQAIQEALVNESKAINAYNKACKYYSEKAMAQEYYKLYSGLA
jgi:glycosyltransferase involved in cell wall biosynthesis